MKETIEAYSGDLDAAEAACADTVDDDTTSSSVPASQRKGKRSQDDDQLLHSLQKRVHESGELLKGIAQPKTITATSAFANYVHDSLVSMSKRKFRQARARINTILTELMDDESDGEEPQRPPSVAAPVNMQHMSASAACTSLTSEMYQPPPHMWTRNAPPASVWGSQTADYVNRYMQQPHGHPMMPPTTQPGLLPAHQVSQPPGSPNISAILSSAAQTLNQSPSIVDNSIQSQ